MCFSAKVIHELKKLGIHFNAQIDYGILEELYELKEHGEKIKFTKAFEFNFSHPKNSQEKKISELIKKSQAAQLTQIEQDLFRQKERIATAERKLVSKPTKTALKEKEVAERQLSRLKSRLERLNSHELTEEDSRIFAFDWAPVIVMRKNERVITPMRYHLRPSGMKADFDKKYPGCYNARRDSLTGFWRNQFGHNHAILIASAFYEHVAGNVLRFNPKGFNHMVIPCIWDHWESIDMPGFNSFAMITDNPPPEVAEAGHDRCPIFIKESRIDDWLQPKGKSDLDLFNILDDRETPYYEHALTG
jgi:putative SOS response-associated peptidase YedK